MPAMILFYGSNYGRFEKDDIPYSCKPMHFQIYYELSLVFAI